MPPIRRDLLVRRWTPEDEANLRRRVLAMAAKTPKENA